MSEYIKREDAISQIDSLASQYYKSKLVCDMTICAGINTALREVQRVPAADVRPVVHAHWIKRPDFYLYRCEKYTATCSSCGLMAGYTEAKRFFHYCPNCGAVMDKEAADDSSDA